MRVQCLAVPLLSALLVAASREAVAAPLTLEHAYNANDLPFGRTTPQSITFTHDLTASGFNLATDTLTSATLSLFFHDDGDPAAEKVDLLLGNALLHNNETIRSGAVPTLFTFAVAPLVGSDGTLSVSMTRQNGTFYFAGSRLTAEVSRVPIATPAPVTIVPEPTSVVLIGTGLAAAALRRRTARRSAVVASKR